MKIVTTLIALLTLVVGTNIFLRVQDQDRLETALILLDERISSNTTTIEKVEDYIVDAGIDFEHMQYIMMDNIRDVATALEKHKHEPVYVEVPVVPEVDSVEIKTEPKPEPEPVETQTRLQELIKCPKCNKMVKLKTLKYSHKKTCSGEECNQKKIIKEEPLPEKQKDEPKPEPKQTPKPEPEQEPPKLTRTKSIIPEKYK